MARKKSLRTSKKQINYTRPQGRGIFFLRFARFGLHPWPIRFESSGRRLESHGFRSLGIRRKSFLSLFLSIALILSGAFLVFFSTYKSGLGWQADFGGSQNIVKSSINEPISKPAKLNIPKINRTLDVSDGFVEDNRWKISSTGVSYLITSGKLGSVGNVVLYGHNTRDVLGGLWRVQNGDIVEVTGEDGKIFKYEIFERKEVKPNAVEILDQTDDSRLTIYTCSGFLDTARFVVVGKLVS